MNVNTQKFQSLYALVGNRWHGGTIGRHSLSQPLRAASSLREGDGNGYGGLYHSTRYSLNRKVAGDFHRPYGGCVLLFIGVVLDEFDGEFVGEAGDDA